MPVAAPAMVYILRTPAYAHKAPILMVMFSRDKFQSRDTHKPLTAPAEGTRAQQTQDMHSR